MCLVSWGAARWEVDRVGYLLNIVLRASLVFFTLDSLINATDERYAGKGLSICNVLIVLVRLRGTRPEPDLP